MSDLFGNPEDRFSDVAAPIIAYQAVCFVSKFQIEKAAGLYYLCSNNKDTDQMHGYHTADLRLCFHVCITLLLCPIFSQEYEDDDEDLDDLDDKEKVTLTGILVDKIFFLTLKNWKICRYHSKIRTKMFYHVWLPPSGANGLANCADPDQTAYLSLPICWLVDSYCDFPENFDHTKKFVLTFKKQIQNTFLESFY